MRKWIALWLASVFVVAGLTSAVLFAQSRRLLPDEYRLLSGSDVGFRIEGTDPAGRPIGTWMLRVDAEWVPVGAYPVIRPVN
jgi:hypothetical protein